MRRQHTLIQYWYVQKRGCPDRGSWLSLRRSTRVEFPHKPELVSADKYIPYRKMLSGVMFKHPEQQDYLLLGNSSFRQFSLLDSDESGMRASFDGGILSGSGSCQLSWSGDGSDSHQLLSTMIDDLQAELAAKQGTSQHYWMDAAEVNSENGYAVLLGAPYHLVALEHEGNVFGFTLKPGRAGLAVSRPDVDSALRDINSLCKHVRWIHPKG